MRSAFAVLSVLLYLGVIKLVNDGVDAFGDPSSRGVFYVVGAFGIAILATVILLFFALDLPVMHPIR